MQYTSVALSLLALLTLLNRWTHAKPMSDDEARRRLYTLAELLDAEITAREQLASLKEPLVTPEESKEIDALPSMGAAVAQNADPFAKHHRYSALPLFDYDPFTAGQNAKRSSNLLRLANQAARGFGRRRK